MISQPNNGGSVSLNADLFFTPLVPSRRCEPGCRASVKQKRGQYYNANSADRVRPALWNSWYLY